MTEVAAAAAATRERWSWSFPIPNRMPLVVSYFTDGFYRREAWELARSCQANSVPYEIDCVESLSSWIANTNRKPAFLLDAARRHPARPLLWLDADARVRRPLTLMVDLATNPECVVAYKTWHRRPASGTVFLPATDKREALLDRWCEEVARDQVATDQVCLGRAVAAFGLTHHELPVSYCWIYDFDPKTEHKIDRPQPGHELVVVEHLQASRFMRSRMVT